MFLVLFCSRRTAYIVTENAKQFTVVGISYMGLILFSKVFYVFDVVYVKSRRVFHANFLVSTLWQSCKESEAIILTAQPKGCCPYSSEKSSLSFNVAIRPKF